jgi:hypothetical protein
MFVGVDTVFRDVKMQASDLAGGRRLELYQLIGMRTARYRCD